MTESMRVRMARAMMDDALWPGAFDHSDYEGGRY